MTRTVAIIGAGQIGYAAARAFGEGGWDVRLLARNNPQWSVPGTSLERYIAGVDTAPTADIVVDTIAFDESDVARYDPDKVGRLIAISSASVYCDEDGRTLDEGSVNGYPDFSTPATENQRTVAPGPKTYSTRKVRMENRALELFGDCATILRPCAIFGEQSRHPREWWFVKRLLDGRGRIPLILNGQSQFQPTDAEDIGHFALQAANRELGGIFNLVTEDNPTVLEMGQILANYFFDYDPEFVLIEETGLVGRTPWSVPKPFLVSGRKMIDSGYNEPSTFGSGMFSAATWLMDLNPADWRAAFPQLAAYPWDLFDYDAEDRFFDERISSSR